MIDIISKMSLIFLNQVNCMHSTQKEARGSVLTSRYKMVTQESDNNDLLLANNDSTQYISVQYAQKHCVKGEQLAVA